VTWWLSPVPVTDDGPRLERAHGDWVWPQAQGRLGAALRQIGENGRYELIGLLNRGGQAYLWAARDHESDDELVVVKTVNPRADDPASGARLAREARLLELLAGEPTVMSVRDWGPGRLRGQDHGTYETDRPWLVLPYRAHLSLDRALELSGGRLGVDAAWQIGHDLAAALQHLHRHQVVHRDLSLRNVLLTPTGCVLADLGMAWAASMVDQTVEQHFTTGITNQSRGVTWGWLAPEAARPPRDGSRPDRDPAVDVFGWGLHVFCALTGQHPWTASGLQPTEDELYAMYDLGAEGTFADLERDDLPTALRELIVAALSTDPAGRPTAEALVAGLGSVPPSQVAAQLAAAPDEVRPAELAEPRSASTSGPPRSRGGRKTRFAAALFACVLAITGCGVTGFQAVRHAREASWSSAVATSVDAAAALATAVRTEAMLPVAGPQAGRVQARRVTDQRFEEVFESLPDAASEGVDRFEFGDIEDGLTRVRNRADQLVGSRTAAEKATAQTEVEAGYVPLLKKARGFVDALTGGMERDGVGPRDQAQVRLARATAKAGFATDDLKVELLGVLGRDKAPSRTELVRIIELDQQHRQQVTAARADARATGDEEIYLRLEGARAMQPALEQWVAVAEGLTERPGPKDNLKLFDRAVIDYRSALQDVTERAAGAYVRNAEHRLHQNWLWLGLSLLAGFMLLVLLGLAWWWGRPTGNRVTSSGGEATSTPEEVEDENQDEAGPVRSEAVHA
jgi:serine/threonine protein kinase